jgi:hypothetical protein
MTLCRTATTPFREFWKGTVGGSGNELRIAARTIDAHGPTAVGVRTACRQPHVRSGQERADPRLRRSMPTISSLPLQRRGGHHVILRHAYEKVAAYIDGFNLYYGIREDGRRHLWLDVEGLVRSLLKPEQQLVAVRYFTAPVRDDPAALSRQQLYWNALGAYSSLLEIRVGRFQRKSKRCFSCGSSWFEYEEKESDVALGPVTPSFGSGTQRSVSRSCRRQSRLTAIRLPAPTTGSRPIAASTLTRRLSGAAPGRAAWWAPVPALGIRRERRWDRGWLRWLPLAGHWSRRSARTQR